MKILRGVVLVALGLFAGLWWSESRQRRELQARKSRKPDEISAAYKGRRERLSDYTIDEIAEHIDKVATELVQPNMTELEAAQVGMTLSEVARSALNWDDERKYREEKRNRRADAWLEGIEGGNLDE